MRRFLNKFFDNQGYQIPSSRSLAIPAGMERPETLDEKLQRMFRAHTSQLAASQGFDTFDEFDDFEDDDDSVSFTSGFEVSEIMPPHLQEPARNEVSAGTQGVDQGEQVPPKAKSPAKKPKQQELPVEDDET